MSQLMPLTLFLLKRGANVPAMRREGVPLPRACRYGSAQPWDQEPIAEPRSCSHLGPWKTPGFILPGIENQGAFSFSFSELISSPQRRRRALGLICKTRPFLRWINFSLLGENARRKAAIPPCPPWQEAFPRRGGGGDAVPAGSGRRSGQGSGQSRWGCGRKGSRVLPGWSVSPGFCTLM